MSAEAGTRPTIETPVRIPIEAYVSPEYARAENHKLWTKVWQIACREEEMPAVGSYATYNILDESIMVVRSGEKEISAFYNVCPHRGRRIAKGCGRAQSLNCRFHGWGWDIGGNNTYVLDREYWGDDLSAEALRLRAFKVDTWGRWVGINTDPDCQPLLEFLKPASPMLDAFGFDKMRYRWHKWLRFPCNWKTALESFIESFHVDATHPQLIQWGSNRWWCRTEGLHAGHGIGAARGGTMRSGSGAISVGATDGMDPRVAMAELFTELWETVGTTSETLVEAANNLVREVPADMPLEELTTHVMQTAAMADAKRGVPWRDMTPEHVAECGMNWHIFPNTTILPGVTYALCYRARSDGYDPDRSIFEAYIIERYPEAKEPKTEWVEEADSTEEKWQLILSQDFQNIGEIQKGMKSRGYRGAIPSPHQEAPINHFNRLLAQYMGTGARRELLDS